MSKLFKCLKHCTLSPTVFIKHSVLSSLYTQKNWFCQQQQSMTDTTFCREIFNDIPTELKQLPDDIYETIFDVQQKSGFIPTIFLVLARRPQEFRAFFAYYDALMKTENSELTNYEKEMICLLYTSPSPRDRG